jgi:hypothetical protein
MKERQGCIYHVVNRKNGKGYVGQDSSDAPEVHRWPTHIYNARRGSKLYFHRALRKNGYEEGFTWAVVWRGPLSLLSKKEAYYIKKLHTFTDDPLGGGYNLTIGGERTTYSSASKKKLSQSASKRWEDDAYRKEMSRINIERTADPTIRKEMSKTRKDIWATKTPKERKAIVRAVKCGHARRTPEENAVLSATRSANAVQQWQVPGFRETRNANHAATLAARTPAERKANSVMHRKLSKKMWAERTPEERTAVSAAIVAGHAKRTPAEQEAYCESHRIGMLKHFSTMSPEERRANWRATHPNGNRPKEKKV